MLYGAYSLGCGYGSHSDGLNLHFCSENCLKRYVDNKVDYDRAMQNKDIQEKGNPGSI